MTNPIVPNDNECALILQDGLYKRFELEKSEDFEFIMKRYFSSEKFQKDFETGSWSGGIDVVADGVPIGLDAGSDSTDISEFREKIEASTTLEFRQSFYQRSLTVVPDTNLAKEYNNCLKENHQIKFGFQPLEVNISEDSCTFTVRFVKEFEVQPMPTVAFFRIRNAENVMPEIKVGEKLKNVTNITCDRDSTKRLEFILTTDLGYMTFPISPSLITESEFINDVLFRDFHKVQDALENKDADPNTILPVPTRISVLMKAADNGDYAISVILVASGADINYISNYGFTPIYMAGAGRNIDVVRFLLDNGAEETINERVKGLSATYNGWTALKNVLYQSTSSNNIPKEQAEFNEIAELLVSRGAIV